MEGVDTTTKRGFSLNDLLVIRNKRFASSYCTCSSPSIVLYGHNIGHNILRENPLIFMLLSLTSWVWLLSVKHPLFYSVQIFVQFASKFFF